MKPYTLLPHRAILALSGEDTAHFLQGLITNDITKATESQSLYACMLTPQGKFLYDFFIYPWKGNYFLDAGTSDASGLVRKLTLYKLRAKLTIENVSDNYSAIAQPDEQQSAMSDDAILLPDPRHVSLGLRGIAKTATISAKSPYEPYNRLRLSLGIPEAGSDMLPDEAFPLPFNMEALNAIDFKKGCYVGQEVTARSKHRGQIKKGICVINGENLPPYGTPITHNGTKIGEMLSSCGNIGLALIRREDYTEHALAGDTAISLNFK